jgi:hypothetical protein
MGEGIVVKQLMGFGQSNLMNGDFSCNVALGFRVCDGRIVGRVKDTMVAGNFYELLSRNVQLSSDVGPVLRMPHALIEGVRKRPPGLRIRRALSSIVRRSGCSVRGDYLRMDRHAQREIDAFRWILIVDISRLVQSQSPSLTSVHHSI